MKARRENGDLIFSGDIIAVTSKPNGNTVTEIQTFPRNTRYSVTFTPKDLAQIKWALFSNGGMK